MDWDMNQELFEEEESEFDDVSEISEIDLVTEVTKLNFEIDDEITKLNFVCDIESDNEGDYCEDIDAGSSAVLATNYDTITPGKNGRNPRTSNRHQNEASRNGFEIKGPLVLWDDDDDDVYGGSFPLSSANASGCNAHGVVHVRLLRARNLPCPVGSSVGATISLNPYKGKVKSSRSKAFPGNLLDHGVCVRWGREPRQPRAFTEHYRNGSNHNSQYRDSILRDDDDGEEDDENILSMVNAWNGPSSPVPSINIDLTFSPLGLGIFDFTMASIELSSEVLIQRPRVWRTRWCPMKVNASSLSQTSYHHNYNDDPFLRIQALFEPSVSSGGPLEHKVLPSLSQTQVSSSTKQRTNEQKSATISPSPPLSGRTLLIENETDPNEIATTDSNGLLSVYQPGETHQEKEAKKSDEQSQKQDTGSFWDTKELALMNIETTSLEEDISTVASKKTTASQKTARAAAAFVKPHLLRTERYLVPTRCAVCSKLLVGIFGKGIGFRCEVCHIDCCSDCRLHVDLKVPCGSELATDIVEASFQNKMSPSGFLSYIAPDEAYEQKRQSMLEGEEAFVQPSGRMNPSSAIIASKQSLAMTGYTKGSQSPMAQNGGTRSAIEGIGRCRFEIVSACLFLKNTKTWSDYGTDAETQPLRRGDYYVRVSMTDSDRSARTPTLQKTGGMPHFRSAEMRFPVSHYGVAFRIDVVEADRDTIIGSALLTTQGILQEQRDAYIAEHGISLLQFLNGPIPWMGTRKMKLPLQSGIKVGAKTDDFYALNSKDSSSQQKGLISGWVDVYVGVEEFYSRMYGSNPIECPKRPPADLNMAVFSNCITRITAIMDDLNYAISLYQYMVSWENPVWTAFTLIVFQWLCRRFNSEYIGSLPILFFVLFLGYCAFQRNQGKIKGRYIKKEIETMQKVEGNSVGYEIYRPRGTITVTVSKGRNLLSQEFGIAGKTSCKVVWDPLRFADEDTKERIVQSDKSADGSFEMGNTPTIYTSDPDWNELEESGIAKRLNQLLPSTANDFFESSSAIDTSSEVKSLSFPILQSTNTADLRTDDGETLEPWESSQGAIVIQVRFQDFFNNIPGFDYVMGEVVFSIRELATEVEVKGWYQILDVGTTTNVRLEDHEVDGEDAFCGTTLNPPRIYVHLKWDPPAESSVDDPTETDREMSHAIQEELVRSSILMKENKVNLVDSSIGSVSKAFGIGGTIQVVQNTLGSIIDLVEGVMNLLNFTDPYKSSTIFVGSFLVWVVFCIIPTRYLILSAGLVQYGVSFVDRYGKALGIIGGKTPVESTLQIEHDKSSNEEDKNGKGSPFAIKVANAIRSIPTNEDLRKAYFWESRQLGTAKAKKYTVEKRESRLKKLWKAKWHSTMKILVQDNEMDNNQQPVFQWDSGFAVVQGHRFIWWKSVNDFDDGELPSGKVIMSGHAGLGGPSPIEMRKLDKEKELPLCLTIFGRGSGGQERITMLLPERSVKQNLENTILHSASFKRD
ncbi:unnamed protein product [Pseudo-nitzschia multistriata]|uniref:Phorbol-ester/DAG-type domain-containing protein n=1 Tax=Pseudo-nitzschia multistriata TaxID=183589 RepID=A0A448Z8C7_9STRA|nr:unnamed protein product [Pseudo-nitzschia multistriata]